MENQLLTREAILQAQDIEYRELIIPEWNGVVRLKALKTVEYEAFQNHVQNKMKKGKMDLRNVTANLISRVIVDAKGERVFTQEDVQALSQKSQKPVNRIWKAVKEMNGIGDDDLDELVGN